MQALGAIEDHEPDIAIQQLEAHIEELGHTLENCRKVAVAARFTIGAGALILAAGLTRTIGFDIAVLMISLSAIIGGLVLLGSNSSTANEASAALARAEADRAALIDSFRLRIVGGLLLH